MRNQKKVLFIYNPHSGRGSIKSNLTDILDVLIQEGYEITIYPTQKATDATNRVIETQGEFDRIICSGGDGTLNEVVKGLMKSDIKVPFGYIPSGSTNDFGNSIGISKDMEVAAKVAAGNHQFSVDIGKFNEDYFVYVAAFGIFTGVSYQTSQELKNLLGHAAYLLEAAKSLSDIPTYSLEIEADGKVIHDEFIFGMITNSTKVGGLKDFIKGDVSLGDGAFEVMLIRAPKNPIELSEILAFLGNIKKNSDNVYTFQTKGLTIHSQKQVPWTLDGENGGIYQDVVIENKYRALEIMVE